MLLLEFFWPHYGTGVDSASVRNEYQEYFLGGKGGRFIGPIVLKSGSLNILEPSGPLQTWNEIALPFTVIAKSGGENKKCAVYRFLVPV